VKIGQLYLVRNWEFRNGTIKNKFALILHIDSEGVLFILSTTTDRSEETSLVRGCNPKPPCFQIPPNEKVTTSGRTFNRVTRFYFAGNINGMSIDLLKELSAKERSDDWGRFREDRLEQIMTCLIESEELSEPFDRRIQMKRNPIQSQETAAE
jgi:hypothetical protein